MKIIITTIISLLFAVTSIGQTQYDLIAWTSGIHITHDGLPVSIFGFTDSYVSPLNIPGPTLEMIEGDSIEIDFLNFSQGMPHTVHLHGLDVNQENDGVPHLSFEVHHQEHGFYRFVAPHPGTYLYHCHVVSSIHVQAGMYGTIIVHPQSGDNMTWDDGYEYDNDYLFFGSEIDTTWHTQEFLLHEHDTSMEMITREVPVYVPQYFLINGQSEQQVETLETTVNETNFLRFANLGYCANRVIIPQELNPLIISSDGRPLPNAMDQDTLWVFPGERYGVITEANSQFSDSIIFDYFDLNTLNIKGTTIVPVLVDGFFGINEKSSAQIQLYPNPSKDKLNISGLEIGDVISIFNIEGKLIEVHNAFNLDLIIDVESYDSGSYIATIVSGREQESFKFIKK